MQALPEGLGQQHPKGCLGSVVVWDQHGYILTNNHVAGDGSNMRVTFEDGTTADAQLVGSNPGYDLAVIKVDRTGLPVTTLGTSVRSPT